MNVEISKCMAIDQLIWLFILDRLQRFREEEGVRERSCVQGSVGRSVAK